MHGKLMLGCDGLPAAAGLGLAKALRQQDSRCLPLPGARCISRLSEFRARFALV